MARYFKGSPVILRFIEYMDVGASNGWKMDEVIPSAEVIRRISESMPLEEIEPNYTGETAERWRYTDGSGEVGVEAEDDVGIGPGAFHLDAGQQRRAVACGDELQVAGAAFLEGLFDRRAGAPFGGEAVIGQDGEHGFVLCHGSGGDSGKAQRKDRSLHVSLHVRRVVGDGERIPCTFPPPV